MPSHRRYLLTRLLLACAAACLSIGLLAGQASAAAPPCADLEIESIVVSPTNPVQGMPANIAVTVFNAGTCTAGGFVTQFRTSVNSQTGPSESINSLAPGESRTLNLPFVFTASGNYQSVVQVDTGNAVSETNEANNLEIEPITVLPPGINLVLENFSVSPVAPNPTNSVVQGRTAIASMTVTNTGNVPAGPFVVQWTPYVFAKPLTRLVSGLAPGATTTVTMEYTFPFAATVSGTAFVDSTKQVKETDELDNSKTLKTVVQPPLPNLRVAPKGVRVQPAPAGSTSTMEVDVENDGNNPAGAFVVTWSPGPFIPAQSQQVNGLGVGEQTTVGFSNLYTFPGNYEGTVTVDSTHVVPEVNESDNTAATLMVVPVATVDLTITDTSIRPTEEQGGDLKANYAAATVTQGVPNTVTVTVQNLGNSPSGSFVTSWNPSSLGIIVPGNQTLTQQTGPLGPGESREITFSFTYPKPGNFRSIADADAFGNVKETNEANNERILNVTVQPAHIALYFTGPITFSPAPPVVKEKATAAFTVRNYGPIATEGFAVQLTPQQGGFTQTQFVNGLNPGEERTFTFPVTYSKTGPITATAVIDPFNQVVKTLTPDEESGSVTVVPKSTTLQVTLDHLHVIKSLDEGFAQGSAEWHNIIFAVFDPSASCNLNIDNGVVKIKQTVKSVACIEERDDDVEPNEDILSPKSIQVKLLEDGPLVAAVGAIEEDSEIPDIPGAGTFVSPHSQYTMLSGLTTVAGKGCKKISGFPDFGSTETINEGHCFDAYLGVSVLGQVGMSARAVPAAATTEANEAVAKVFSWTQTATSTSGAAPSSVTVKTISTP